jgi:hypothetical protein
MADVSRSLFCQAYGPLRSRKREILSTWIYIASLIALMVYTNAATAASSVEFTSMPPYGSFSNLQGNVHGVHPPDFRVVVLINVNGGYAR